MLDEIKYSELRTIHFHAVMERSRNPAICESLIEKMKQLDITRDAIAYTLLISAYCDQLQVKKAVEVLKQMKVRNQTDPNQPLNRELNFFCRMIE
jgi:pentatricopeptide repeat protein